MAVYSLSLKTLVRSRERQQKAKDLRPAPCGTGAEESHEAVPQTRIESHAPAAMGRAEFPLSVAELLSRSGPELDAFLAECGQSVSRVLIALIYRLGAIETQLARLSASRRAPGMTLVHSGRSEKSSPEADGMSKNALLDQVFRKNMALREVS